MQQPPNKLIVKISKTSELKKQVADLCLILLTVLLFYLAFPTVGFSVFVWLVLIPVLLVLHKQNSRQAFITGFLAAMLGWLFSIWWVVPGLSSITSSSSQLIIPFILLYCCLSALPYAVGCFLHVYLKCAESMCGAFLSAPIFTVLVNYTPQILPGNMAHALYLQPQLIQGAAIGGVPLVFFIIHSVNFLLANALTINKEQRNKRLFCVFSALLIFSSNYLYGLLSINQQENIEQKNIKTLKVVMVQPNITINNRTREDWRQLAPELAEMLHDIENTEQVDLIILPELPVPISFQYFDFDNKLFAPFVKRNMLLLTTIKPLGDTFTDQNGYLNTMELLINQQAVQTYAKQVLLPFGEYLPYESTFPWLRKLFPDAPNYQHGKTSTIFELPLAQSTVRVVPLICYEAVLTDTVAKAVDTSTDNIDADILINTSNDAWFGDSAGQRVHLALSTFRSVEYRKIMVRNTNNGISVIIDPYGRQIAGSKIMPHQRGYSVTTLDIVAKSSFYQRYPNVFKWCILLLTTFGTAAFIRKNYQNRQ